jgi:phage major head subunit gpT-like protein
MSVMTTASFAKLMWPGLNKIFGTNYNEYPPEYTKLFDVSGSTKAYEEDQGITGFGLAYEKSEGSGIIFDEASQNFTMRYVNKTYTLGFAITQETIEDNQYDLSIVGKNQASGLGRSMRLTREYIGANVFNLAFDTNTKYGTAYNLIGSAQPTKASGTFANTLATAADMSELSLEQALIDIAGFKDDRGNIIAVKGRTLHIPKELEFEAKRILGSSLQSGTANNDLNALNSLGKFPGGVHINHFFTDTDAWFIRTDITADQGLRWFDRVKTEFAMDDDFKTTNALYRARFRVSCGLTDARSVYGSPGA